MERATIYGPLTAYLSRDQKLKLLKEPRIELVSNIMPGHMHGDMYMVIQISQFEFLNKHTKGSDNYKPQKPHDKVKYRYFDGDYQLSRGLDGRIRSYTAVHYPTLPHSEAAKMTKSCQKETCKLCWDNRQDLVG